MQLPINGKLKTGFEFEKRVMATMGGRRESDMTIDGQHGSLCLSPASEAVMVKYAVEALR